MFLRLFLRGSVFGALCVVSLLGAQSLVLAAPTLGKPAAPGKTPIHKAPNSQTVRAAVFTYLEKKAGGPIALPAFPREKLLMWVDGRRSAVAPNDPARYRLLGEHLRIAEQLMEGTDLAVRKRGFWIAGESANFAAAQLSADKQVLADIYEGFLLPQVALANVALWQDPSRCRILENGASAFGDAGEREKQRHVLEWIIALGQRKSTAQNPSTTFVMDINTLNWARGTLAGLLFGMLDAKQGDVQRALTLLRAVPPDMVGFKHLQTQVQARLDGLRAQPPKAIPSPPAVP